MNFQLVALEPTSPEYKEVYVSEWAWRPIRSMLAICYFIECKELNVTPDSVHLEKFKELDDNMGEGITDVDLCNVLAKRLNQLIANPEIIEDYGMTVDMLDGEFIFTYPPALCTSAMQHKHSKNIINSAVKESQYDHVCSMLRATERDLSEVVDFMLNCNGFLMP